MAYDLANKVPEPHGAACITLTNTAADQLQRRIEYFGSNRITSFVGTVHRFAWRRIVSPFAGLAGRAEIKNFSIANRTEETAAFTDALNAVFSRYENTKYVRSTIEFNRKRFADAATWAVHGEKILRVKELFLDNLHARGLTDFTEIIEVAVDVMENNRSARKAINACFPHIYVDEYQDLAPGINRLVKALCFDYVHGSELFAVGDPDQAILGFTGTQPELLIELAKRQDVHTVKLDKNYRCGQEIIRIASIMKQRKQDIVVGERIGGKIGATYCPGGFDHQSHSAAQRALAAQQQGAPLHEILAICPTNAQCEQVARYLRSVGLAAHFRGDEYRDTVATSFVEGCAAWAVSGRELSDYRLHFLLDRWRYLLGSKRTRECDILLIDTLKSYKDNPFTPAANFLWSLLDIGLADALNRERLSGEAIEVTKMIDALCTGSLADGTVAQLAERALKKDRVEVTTMTSSKSLEFDLVLILGMDQKAVPHFASFGDTEKMAEDRRKFYVSLTRARDEVQIFYSGFVVWKSGRADPAGSSVFLQELGLI
jgi:DNA helicase-2/ATP-dependent DNA helicase PcrA